MSAPAIFVPDLAAWAAGRGAPAPRLRRILVVGLGSAAPCLIAARHPEAETLGVDEDPGLVALTRAAAGEAGPGALALAAASLEDPQALPGGFDWIHCPDPLRPAGDEDAAWRTLAGWLAPDGWLTARFRSRRQTREGDELREAVGILADAEGVQELDGYLALGHRLTRDLAAGGTRLAARAREVEAALRAEAPVEAALALLPAGRAHTPASAEAVLERAGLAVLGVLDAQAWTPRALADPEIAGLLPGLTDQERRELADILHAPDIQLVCRRADRAAR
ncbi:MAG: class I SAM-dependent methyltransferase [Candidatus Methylomirabilales bacterium]